MKIRRSPNAFTVYTDALLYLFATSLMLLSLIISIVHNQAKKNEDYHPKAEYLITLTWDDKRNVDLDLWLRGPVAMGEKPVMYQNKEAKNVALDRDSRGYLTNRTELGNGVYADSGNREIISIRAIIPGDYVVQVSYYDGKDKDNNGYPELKVVPEAMILAKVQVDKVNPTVTSVVTKEVAFTFSKEIQTVLAFRIEENGDVKAIPVPENVSISEVGNLRPEPRER